MQEELFENIEDEDDTVLVFTVPEGATGRLDAWLAAQTSELSRARIQALIKEGRVTCAETVKANASIKAGQVFEIDVPPPQPAIRNRRRSLDILYEDRDLLLSTNQPGWWCIRAGTCRRRWSTPCTTAAT